MAFRRTSSRVWVSPPALVRRLLAEAPCKLSAAGCVLAEIDPGQQSAFGAQLAPYAGHRFHKDLGGRVRVLEAWR